MKSIITVLFCLCVPLMGADKKLLTKEQSAKKIEAAIRSKLKKPKGELTKADYEKVTRLRLNDNRLTAVKGLEKLTQLTRLLLHNNYLTEARSLENLTQLKELSTLYDAWSDQCSVTTTNR